MLYNSAGKALAIADADNFAAFMLQLMNQEQRARLMAERPALYARLFPGVNAEIIISRVREQIKADKA